jgi:hypothetical protein
MPNKHVTQVDPENLSDWIYSKGFDNLLVESKRLISVAHNLYQTDDNGDPTDNALEANRVLSDFTYLADVIVTLKNQIELLESRS